MNIGKEEVTLFQDSLPRLCVSESDHFAQGHQTQGNPRLTPLADFWR